MSRKPSPAMLVAVLALVVALGGTAVAAEQYVITSTNQIKPSVLAELRALRTRARAASVEPPALVVARARSTHSVLSGSATEPTHDPLNGNTWTQRADELNQVTGEVIATAGAGCGASSRVKVYAYVNNWSGVTGNQLVLKNSFGQGEHEVWAPGETKHFGLTYETSNTTPWQLFEWSTAKTHELSVQASDTCESGHFTIDSVALDVVGAS